MPLVHQNRDTTTLSHTHRPAMLLTAMPHATDYSLEGLIGSRVGVSVNTWLPAPRVAHLGNLPFPHARILLRILRGRPQGPAGSCVLSSSNSSFLFPTPAPATVRSSVLSLVVLTQYIAAQFLSASPAAATSAFQPQGGSSRLLIQSSLLLDH